MEPNGAVAIVAAVVAVASVLFQYLNARNWEARRWMRDARLPQYVDFLLAANLYFAALQKREKAESAEERGRKLEGADAIEFQRLMRAALAAITLLGPERVTGAARLMNNTLYAFDKGQLVGGTGERIANLERFNESYRGHREIYIEGCRRTLLARNPLFRRSAASSGPTEVGS
jgi:hypothetical protein